MDGLILFFSRSLLLFTLGTRSGSYENIKDCGCVCVTCVGPQSSCIGEQAILVVVVVKLQDDYGPSCSYRCECKQAGKQTYFASGVFSLIQLDEKLEEENNGIGPA